VEAGAVPGVPSRNIPIREILLNLLVGIWCKIMYSRSLLDLISSSLTFNTGRSTIPFMVCFHSIYQVPFMTEQVFCSLVPGLVGRWHCPGGLSLKVPFFNYFLFNIFFSIMFLMCLIGCSEQK